MRTEMNTEMRELTDNELDAVNGGVIPLVLLSENEGLIWLIR